MFQKPTEDAIAPGGERASPAVLHQRIFAPYKLAILVDAAAEHGICPETVLAGTALTRAHVHDQHTRTSVNDYIVAWENIIAAGAALSLALDVGARLHLSAYGMYGYALMCSPTMRDFCDFAVRYHLLATPLLRLGWREEGGRAIWEFGEVPGVTLSVAARHFLVRQQMMTTATHVRDISGAVVAPVQARFGLPDAGDGAELARRLGCPCSFDHAVHELQYPVDLLDRAPQFANRLTYAWLEETCADLIGRSLAVPGMADEIYQRLMRAQHYAPSMETIARDLNVTERTLRRRLTAEGTSFAEIANDVRRRLTLRYLETTRMSADDIAAKVGFSDSANLRRAVKRWTGRTFGEVRSGA